MAHSSVSYTAGSGQTEFAIPFEIIDADWIYMTVDGAAETTFTVDIGDAELTWTGAGLNGEAVVIYRVTPVGADDEPVTWEAGPASPDDLALDQKKRRAHIEELTDAAEGSGQALFIMPFSKVDSAGTGPHDEGWRWGTAVYDDYDDGAECRVLFNEVDAGIPWEYGNSGGYITHMDSSEADKYKHTLRLSPGTYVVRMTIGVSNYGTEHTANPEISLRYSDDDAASWTILYEEDAEMDFSEDDDNALSTEFAQSLVHIVPLADTYHYLATVLHDNDADASTGYTGVYNGYMELTKIA